MNRLTQTLIGLGLLAGLAMPVAALAAGPGGTCGYGGQHTGRMAQALNLTDEQQTKMQQARDKMRPQFQALRQQMRDNRKAIYELDTTAKDYESKLAALAREQGKLTEQMVVLHGQMRAETQAILTPEQREQAKKLWQQRRDRMQQRMRDGKRGDCPHYNGQGGGRPGPGGMQGQGGMM